MKIKRESSLKILIYIVSFIIFIFILNKLLEVYKHYKKSNYIEKTPVIHQLDIVFGSDSAKNTMFLYGNYTCQYCRRFFKEVFPDLNKNYIKTGKMRLVWKIVEFNTNEKLLNAMKTAVCIHSFGNFDKLHELLLEEPHVVYLPEFEEMINHFMESDPLVAECIMSQETETYLLDIKKEFHNFGFKGTPTFVIENKYLTGFLPYREFEKWINKNIH